MIFVNGTLKMSKVPKLPKMPKIVECYQYLIKTTEFLKSSIFSLQSSIFNRFSTTDNQSYRHEYRQIQL